MAKDYGREEEGETFWFRTIWDGFTEEKAFELGSEAVKSFDRWKGIAAGRNGYNEKGTEMGRSRTYAGV